MKKSPSTLTILLICCAAFSNADTWRSVKNEKLEGNFIRYNLAEEKVTIQRAYDGRIFSIPETDLIHADRIKAVRLEAKDISDYWYTDYQKAISENPDKQFLVLYRNNAEPNAFERFYTKLLLQKYFVQLLESRDFIVCVPESVPSELLEIGRNPEASKASPQKLPYSGRPLAIITDPSAEPFLKGSPVRAIFSIEKPLILTDPYMDLPKEQQYIPFEDMDRYIRNSNRVAQP